MPVAQSMQKWAKTLSEAQIKEMLRRVLGPSRRQLEGKEYDQVWMLLQVLEPIRESNNQRTWTSEYILNGKRYDVTHGIEDTPIIEEVSTND